MTEPSPQILPQLTAADSHALVRAVAGRAADRDVPVAISVVDADAEQLHLHRQEEVHPLFARLARARAFTAAAMGMPYEVLQGWQQEKPLLHMQLARINGEPFAAARSAATLQRDGRPLGAIAVSGPVGEDLPDILRLPLQQLGYDHDHDPVTGDHEPGPTPRGPSAPAAPLPAVEAEAIVQHALAVSNAAGFAVAAAVVDRRGDVLSASRHEAQAAATIGVASAKAFTAAVLRQPTTSLDRWIAADPVGFMQLAGLAAEPLIADFGGLPIRAHGQIVGALGLSGAHGAKEQELCVDVLTELGYGTAARG